MRIADTEFQSKKITFKNRIILPPMYTGKADTEGKVTSELLQYYDERTKGGYFAAVIVEHSYISKQGKASENQLSAASDDTIEGLAKLAEVIHKNGSKAVIQLNHAGCRAKREVTGEDAVSPSLVAFTNFTGSAAGDRLIDLNDINKIITDFAESAKRGVAAGFDAVEIHSAHGYLLNQFYSPITNRRTDSYGGSLKNRLRLHTEIIARVREAVGEEYPIFLRLGAIDYQAGGNVAVDAVQAAGLLAKAGVDVLDISGGLSGFVLKEREDEPGYFAEGSLAAKKGTDIPVILTGGFKSLDTIETSLEAGKADLIGVGRAVYANPDWAKQQFELQS